METFVVLSKFNKNIRFTLPWFNPKIKTLCVGLKEISFDNFIENVEENLLIEIYNKNKKDSEIVIEKGSYDLEEILDLIKIKLDALKIVNLHFNFNKHNGKFDVDNKTKSYSLKLSPFSQQFLKLPEYIEAGKRVKSYEIFEIMKTKSLYVRIDGLIYGIRSNVNIRGNGEIIHVTALSNNYGQTKIEHVTNTPIFYHFTNKYLKDIELSITDEYGVEVNIQNIRILLYFNTELN